MARGQLSVEFFLVVSFLFVLSALLIVGTESQVKKTSIMEKTVLSKATLDSLASMINFVFLSGNGSILQRNLFVPKDVVCFMLNPSENALVCDVDPSLEEKRVYSNELLASTIFFENTCPPYSTTEGWFNVRAVNNGSIYITCTRMS